MCGGMYAIFNRSCGNNGIAVSYAGKTAAPQRATCSFVVCIFSAQHMPLFWCKCAYIFLKEFPLKLYSLLTHCFKYKRETATTRGDVGELRVEMRRAATFVCFFNKIYKFKKVVRWEITHREN